MFAPSISSWIFVYIMLREIHSERECSNMRKIGQKKKYIYLFFIFYLFIYLFFFFLGGGAWVRRIYEKLCLDSPRVANLGRCHAYLGCRNMLLRDFHLPLFVTDKWVKCYCELILGLASLHPYIEPTRKAMFHPFHFT